MNVQALFADPVVYSGPLAYLATLATSHRFNRQLSKTFHLGAAFLLAAFSVVIQGFPAALISLASAAVLFVIMVLTGLLSRTSIFAVAITSIALPIKSWWVFIFGMLLAGLVSFTRLRKIAGREYVSMVAGETVAALTMGQTILPGLNKLDLKRMPLPDSQNESNSPIGQAMRAKVYLPAYFLVAFILTATAAVLISR